MRTGTVLTAIVAGSIGARDDRDRKQRCDPKGERAARDLGHGDGECEERDRRRRERSERFEDERGDGARDDDPARRGAHEAQRRATTPGVGTTGDRRRARTVRPNAAC
ncbi:MAG: hypothetical protein NVS1B2_09210 [Vulcanimicrobiaceae bacterium]